MKVPQKLVPWIETNWNDNPIKFYGNICYMAPNPKGMSGCRMLQNPTEIGFFQDYYVPNIYRFVTGYVALNKLHTGQVVIRNLNLFKSRHRTY